MSSDKLLCKDEAEAPVTNAEAAGTIGVTVSAGNATDEADAAAGKEFAQEAIGGGRLCGATFGVAPVGLVTTGIVVALAGAEPAALPSFLACN